MYNSYYCYWGHFITSGHLNNTGRRAASQVAPVVNNTCQCRKSKRSAFDPWVGKIPWRRAWQSISVFLLRESCGERNCQAMVCRVTKSRMCQAYHAHAMGVVNWCFSSPFFHSIISAVYLKTVNNGEPHIDLKNSRAELMESGATQCL